MLRYVTGNIRVFAFTDLLGNFARSLVFPYAPLYILALGGDAQQIGLVTFLSQCAGLVLLPIAGHITDHSDRIRLLVLAGFLSSGFLLLNIVAPTWQFVGLAALLSGMVVFQFPAYASLIADSLPPEGRGRGLGVLNTISSSLSIFAPYIGGAVIQRYGANVGMRFLYLVMFISYLAAAYLQMRFLRESASSAPREALHIGALLNALKQAYRGIPGLVRQMPRPLKALALIVVLSFMANGASGSFWVIYAIEHGGLTTAEWGLVLLVEAAVRTVLFLPAGLLVDRWGRTMTLVTGLVLTTITTPLFVILHGLTAVLLLRSVSAGGLVLAMPACMAFMADLTPRRARGQMMAAIGQGGIVPGMATGGAGGPSVGYLIIPPLMAASLAGGFLYTANPILPWIFATVAGVASIGLAIAYLRDAREAEV